MNRFSSSSAAVSASWEVVIAAKAATEADRLEAFFLSEAKEAVPAAAGGAGGEGGEGGADAAGGAGGVFTTFLTFGTVLVFFRPRPLSENAKNTHTLLNNASKDLVQDVDDVGRTWLKKK